MKLPAEGHLLRIFIGEGDRWEGKPLYEAIVLKARALHLAGATVLRGPMGFGAHSHLHTAKILRLSEDLPILIEIVDKDHARVEGYWQTVFAGQGPSVPVRVAAAGREVNELVRVNGQWLIQSRDVAPKD